MAILPTSHSSVSRFTDRQTDRQTDDTVCTITPVSALLIVLGACFLLLSVSRSAIFNYFLTFYSEIKPKVTN